MGVAQVGFSLSGPQLQRGVLVRRTWYNDLLYIISFVYCGAGVSSWGDLFASRNALGICMCGVCVIENFNIRQTARFSYTSLNS